MIQLLMALCLFVMSSAPATAALTREPYLQSVSSASITIVWQTDSGSGNVSRVQYGTGSGNLNQTAQGSGVISSFNGAVRNHVVTISGLSPDTTYFYNVGTTTDGVQGGGTTNHFFLTAPIVGTPKPFSVWLVGDSGDGSSDQTAVREAMLTVTGSTPPNLFLHAGDMAYESGTDPEFTSNHFSIYEDILRQTPYVPTLGNHESFTSPSAGVGPYYEAHVLPTGSSGTEAYYSFDYANVHFIVLDSMTSSLSPGSTMLTWLQADLSGTAQEWVIALFHHPPYTKGSHDSDSAVDSGGRLVNMRENVVPLLEAGGVDLVLAGHSHIYERSYPLRGAYGYGSSPNFVTPSFSTLNTNGNILDTGNGNPSGNGAYETGTVYMVSGHGGKSVGSGSANHPVMFFSEKEFGSVLLEVNGPILTVQNIRSNNAITDTFTIDKTSEGEIVWRNTIDGAVALWLMNGLTVNTTGIPSGAPTDWTIVGKGDLNNDGKIDLVWRNTVGDVAVWLLNGANPPTTIGVVGGAPLEWVVASVDDMDNDDKADIVWRNTSTGAVAVWLMNGLIVNGTGVPSSASTDWTIVGIGDLNSDGKADLVWRNTVGDVAVWLMDGVNPPTTIGVVGGAPLEWVVAGVDDMDNDDKADIVWRNTSTGDVAVWLMNGLTVSSSGIPGAASTDWTIKDVGDLNGDNKADLVWRRAGVDVAVWLMDGLNAPAAIGVIGGAPLEWEIR